MKKVQAGVFVEYSVVFGITIMVLILMLIGTTAIPNHG